MERIYLDNAATTQLEPAVLEAMLPYLKAQYGNPSSIHGYGREAKIAVETARKSIAATLNTTPASIFFTSGGTESINTALRIAVYDLGCTHIISSPLEHHATLHTIEHLQRVAGVQVSHVVLRPGGEIDIENLEQQLRACKPPVLVCLMHANNEIATRLDIHAVGALCRQHGAFFMSDTVQTVGHYPMDLKNTAVDFITGAAHKFHGPKGIGLLYVRQGILARPLLYGGGQERGLRAGTENVAGIVGFAKALDIASKTFEFSAQYTWGLKLFLRTLLSLGFPGLNFNGDSSSHGLYTVLNANFPKNEKTASLVLQLDQQGICVSGGSACLAGQGSHVIKALHPKDDVVAVRFSFSKYNTKEELDTVVNVLKSLKL